LRAIGPATHRVMSMADLREGCETAGFDNVATYVATGNLVLSAPGSAGSVREAVQAVVDGHGLGRTCDVFVRSLRQLRALVKADPFPAATGERPQRVGVCFFQRRPHWPAWVDAHDGPEIIATSGAHLMIDYGPGEAA